MQVKAPESEGIGGFRLGVRAVGNVLLGMALGLLAYYWLTNAVTAIEQQALRDDLDGLGSISAEDPLDFIEEMPSVEETWTVWDTWAGEDLAYWKALENGGVFGRLIIERMELDVVIIKGHDPANLKKGPSWIDYTDLPAPTGNVGISGHRTTYGAPFLRLNELQPGDTIDFYSPYRLYEYVVTESFQVTPDRVDVVESTEEPRLTLTACDPPYSARYRLIVWSDLAEVRQLEESERPSSSE